jgi:hypothetical protein
MIEILTEKKVLPPRIVLYGIEGVGKTTFGASLPNPFFICSEGGADQFNLQRVNVTEVGQLDEIFTHLRKNMDSFSSIVIDSIDWLEEIFGLAIAQKEKAESLESIPWGKGPDLLKVEIKKLLKVLDWFRTQGKLICLIAHSEVKRFNDPDMDEPYDRYTLKCNKKTTPTYKEWSDCLFFTNFKKVVVSNKARGLGERKVWANHSNSLDAKNRYSIPDGLNLDFNEFTKYFN